MWRGEKNRAIFARFWLLRDESLLPHRKGDNAKPIGHFRLSDFPPRDDFSRSSDFVAAVVQFA